MSGRETTTIDKHPRRIAGMFDAIAPRYDTLNHLLSAGRDRSWRRRAILELRLSGRERVLDVCTGTADLAIEAATSRAGCASEVIGLDSAEGMLALGLAKIRRAGLERLIHLVRGDATRIPVADRSVDAITIAFGIRNVERIDAACAEMRRVLTPGGRLAILEFAVPTTPGLSAIYLWYCRSVLPRIGRVVSRHTAAYDYLPASIDAFASPAEFVTLLRQAGFVDVQAVPLTMGSVILYTGSRGPGDH